MFKHKGMNRYVVLGAASLLPLCFANTSAIAQEESESSRDTSELLEEVVVVGVRRQQQQIIDAKRNTDSVADFVTSDDINQLPDFNVAEALRRIPGVSLRLDFRFDREGYVTVRGLNSTYNYTELDGGLIPSTANDNRTVLLDAIPSSVLTRAEVHKSFTAEQEGSAIGAYISLRSASAFDRDGVVANLSGDYGSTEHDGWQNPDPTFRLAGAFSTTFGDIDQFGFTVAGTYREEDRYLYNPSIRVYFFHDPVTGALVPTEDATAPGANVNPSTRIDAQFAWRYDREVLGGLTKLEWKPSDESYNFLQFFYSDFFEASDRQGVEWDWRANYQPLNQTEFTGLVNTVVRSTPALVHWDTTNKVWSVHGGGEYTIAGDDTLNFNIQYAEGEFTAPIQQYRTGFDTTFPTDERLAYNYDFNGSFSNFPVRTLVDTTAYNDLSLYGALPGHRYFGDDNNETTFEAKFDYRHVLSEFSDGDFAIKFGGKITNIERMQDRLWVDYDLNANVTLAEYNLGLFALPVDFRLPTGTHAHELFITDQSAVQGYFDDNPQNFTLRQSSFSRNFVDDFTVDETVAAAYVQTEYERGPFTFKGGFRYESTDVDSTGLQPSTDPSVANGFIRISNNNSYNDVLPRALVTYDISDQLVVRGAVSQSVSRPNFRDLRANRSTFKYDPVFGSASIAGGNTDLEPRQSDNYDFSLEYYPEWVDGLLSFAVLRKNITNEIASPVIRTPGVLVTPLPTGGFEFGGDPANGAVPADLVETFPVNLDEFTMEGVELGAIVNDLSFIHDSLGNFGASANYAYTKSDLTITRANGATRDLETLIGQPEHVANVAAFAQFGDFEGRIAYNYQSEYLNTIGGTASEDDIWGERGIWSAQLRYNLTDNFIIQARSNNVTNETIQQNTGFGAFRQLRDTGTLHWFGFTYRLDRG